MKKSKLILLLRTFEKPELLQLEHFLTSPYFNKDETVLRLFYHLKTYYPDFSGPSLTKRNGFQQLFPNQSYDGKQFGYLMSNLNKLLEKFLSLQKIEQEPYQVNLALLECLSERGLTKSFQQTERVLERELKARKGNSFKYFLAKYQLSEIKEHHFERQRLRKFDDNIQTAAHHLDRYYFLQRLKLSCAMVDRQTIFQGEYQLNLSAEWIKHLKGQNFFEAPFIQLYFTIFQALREENNEKHFDRLKTFLAKHGHSIPLNDLRDIYHFAINYCARKIRQGKEAYLQEALGLYRTGIEAGPLIENGLLSPWAFTNVVKLSLRLQNYAWVESFIQKYAPQLPEQFRDNALHYNLAELYYYTNRFRQAQEHLNEVAFSDLNYYLGARVLLAKIYFELEEEEALLSLIASFTIFLKRNRQISNDLKHTYLNFCRILFQLVRRSPSRMSGLLEKIKSTELLTDRNWLEAVYMQTFQGLNL